MYGKTLRQRNSSGWRSQHSGLFYSRAEAEKIVVMLRDDPDRAGYRYEIVEAVRHVLSVKTVQRSQAAQKENSS